MMKKACYIVLISISICVCLLSCSSKEGEKYIEINSVDELYTMEADNNYKLMCDIDLQNEYWVPLVVNKFDGNGHSISNCVISDYYQHEDKYNGERGEEYRFQSFFSSANEVKDLTLENISILANNVTNVAVVVASSDMRQMSNEYICKISNVNVNNCRIVATYTASEGTNLSSWNMTCGFIVGEMRFEGLVTGCRVRNSQLNINTDKLNIDVGGIMGGGDLSEVQISDCICDKVSIFVKNNGNYKTINVGGILGTASSMRNINSCVTKYSMLSVESINQCQSRIGGIFGYVLNQQNANVTNCASISNELYAKTRYGYNVGGIAGRSEVPITNCYIDSNKMSASIEKQDSSIGAYMGGVAGTSDSTVKKCISCNNILSGTKYSGERFTAGCVAYSEASIVNCMVMNNTITGGDTDVFSGKSSVVKESFILATDSSLSNYHDVAVADLSDWKMIFSQLKLDSMYWTFNSINGIILKIAEDVEQ